MPKPGVLAWYYLNTNLLRLTRARSQQAGGDIINGATGTASVLDQSGNTLGVADLIYVPASQGQYEATFPAELPVVLGSFITVVIDLRASDVLKFHGTLSARVVNGT